ncbi:TIGR02302 family protein [Lichenibacterium dinghuense]|uniref:TIGR02302 family protein n=1 Tax=Lichenibacterium dinghuense TaxID=2895977 RepID=UPI001F353359|nr:TIGR02302 family protein [Lichenibacterium sp. 6Y81]
MADAGEKRRALDRPLARARAVLVFERLWPAAVAVLALAGLFLAVSWFGLWVALPRALRAVGVLAFAAALAAVLWTAARGRLPGRRDALARLDRDSGLPHRPISSAEDALADPDADATTRALWALHQRRLEAALTALRVRAPSPRLVDRDRYALRAGALLLAAAGAFAAGPDRDGRLAAAFDWFGAGAPAAGFRLDSWIDPPAYTGRPPVVLSGAGAPPASADGAPAVVAAPVGSTVVVRAAGAGKVEVAAEGGVTAAPGPDAAPDKPAPQAGADAATERRFKLGGDGRVTVKRDGAALASYDLRAIPDLPPTIALDGRPVRNARGSMTLRYTVGDDYGVVSAEALLSDPIVNGTPVTGRTLVPPPKLPLALPAAARGLGKGETTADLADSPWAGATVTMVLAAHDEGGNTGRSAPTSVVLPARGFSQPLARALVEQRRNLVLDPDHRDGLDTALDALTLAPDVFDIPPPVFLGLRTAKTRLDEARTDEDLIGVADLLWAMALQIEDGDLSKTEADLKALQAELKDALARNAPPEEIKRLTDALRKQLDKYLAEMARKAESQQRADRQDPNARTRTVTPDQLQRMIDRMEQAMKDGDVAEAQRMLDQLRGVLDNLKTAKRRSNAQQQAQRQMDQSMRDLDRMTRDQQALRDDTFKKGREDRKAQGDGDDGDAQDNGDQPDAGQQGDGKQADGQGGADGAPQDGAGQQGGQMPGGQGQKGGAGSGGQGGDLGGRQNALRQRLGQLQKQMRDLGLEGEKGFDAAGKAMKEAESALGEGQGGTDRAVEAQGRALRGLQQGAQGLQKQMAQQGQGQQNAQDGEGDDDGTGGPNGQRTDPLGRPRRGQADMGGNSNDPDGRTVGASPGARAQQVLEELRRRLGDPSRPQAEQDYLERLLRRY